ncbi:hypothetical protein SESBI_28751 [Sesbania bispinosa]|nr:hypothetical protein SESBI_28751 [Sesbania bispinosa]
MGRKTETHDLPSCPGATKLWYNDASYRASSNCKREYIPVILYKGKSRKYKILETILSGNIFMLSYMVIIMMKELCCADISKG